MFATFATVRYNVPYLARAPLKITTLPRQGQQNLPEVIGEYS